MKRWMLIVSILLIIAFGVVMAMFFYSRNQSSNYKVERQSAIYTNNEISNNIQIITTSSAEEKTSPNALLIFETYYKNCKHTTTENINIPKDLVNKSKEEIEEKYKDWEMKEYSTNEIKLYKQEDGICSEHYILRENKGYISIYVIDEYGNETLKETTGIVTAYLPEADLLNLRQGIKVVGNEELNATLEDYE